MNISAAAAFKEPWGLEGRRGERREGKLGRLCSEAPLISGAQTDKHRERRLLPPPVSSYCYFSLLSRLYFAPHFFSLFIIRLLSPSSLSSADSHRISASSAWIDAGGVNSCIRSSLPSGLSTPSSFGPAFSVAQHLLGIGTARRFFCFVFFCATIVTPQKKPGRSLFLNSQICVSIRTTATMLLSHAHRPKYTHAAWHASKMLTADICLCANSKKNNVVLTHCMASVLSFFLLLLFFVCFLMETSSYLRIKPVLWA